MGEAMFAEGYGMVELAGLVAVKVSLPFLPDLFGDTLGIPLPPYKLKVVDDEGGELPPGEVGELVVSGPGVLRGYHRNEAATRAARTEDGWIRTGDLARLSRFGLLQFVGRKKEVIKHGGYSVFPAEIEDTLRGHPSVADAAVIGRPDPVKGEVPVAFLELAPGEAVDPHALQDWAAERLAEYKMPKELRVIDALPRTGTGKVSRPALRELL
jgi:acyl-CoA synthetase (AMP-forming)/AMP-acid ligase II